jgi:hypothetical protein
MQFFRETLPNERANVRDQASDNFSGSSITTYFGFWSKCDIKKFIQQLMENQSLLYFHKTLHANLELTYDLMPLKGHQIFCERPTFCKYSEFSMMIEIS